jgi:aryl-alcohol dehydrogenase-like predicted oxidoreductase
MSTVGFGGYRISINSEGHEEALKYALESGVKLIDTSSNYTDGGSEELIGKVLKEHWQSKPIIISKVGYIQGKDFQALKELHAVNKAKEDLVEISEDLKHSIHPDFLEDQITRSLERLGLESIDAYLLHNPEYYLKTEGSTKEEYYRRIKLAFDKMEDLVSRGLIKSYGISSNTLVAPKNDHMSTDLDIVMGAARSVTKNHNFKYIQFPMNVIEMGALERQYDGNNLIEQANSLGLKTIINRPLNCFSEQGLLRLAIYPVDEKYENELNADKFFNECIQPLVIKWLEVREDEGDKLFDIPVMKQITSMWYKQKSKDAVDQVFMGYFFPLIANIWGGDLSAKESQSFYNLYDHAMQFAVHNMNQRALLFQEQAIDKGLIHESNLSLSQKVIEKYQSFGVDYILVGMREKSYVDDMKSFF